MKIHICKENPCPVREEECRQVLINGCTTHYTNMFKEKPDGQTHHYNDGCGEKEHNCGHANCGTSQCDIKTNHYYGSKSNTSRNGYTEGTITDVEPKLIPREKIEELPEFSDKIRKHVQESQEGELLMWDKINQCVRAINKMRGL